MEYFKKLICKLFGHVHIEEMYAAPLVVKERRYVVVKELKVEK